MGYGGAIYNYGVLSLNKDTFTNNTATNDGGAIFNMGGNVNETNDTFNNNTATNEGGAIYNEGPLFISQDTFNNNSANEGGAIYTKYFITYINFSEFLNNTALTGSQIYYFEASINAINNWWGSNTPNSSGFDIVNGGGDLLIITHG